MVLAPQPQRATKRPLPLPRLAIAFRRPEWFWVPAHLPVPGLKSGNLMVI